MKRLRTWIVALLVALSMGTTALAVGVPAANVNPQQSGHIVYLETLYGERRAKKIVDNYYKRDGEKPPHVETIGSTGGSLEIPQPGSQPLDLSQLRVGEYFTMHGRRYIVGRFSTIGPSPVLVAFPVDEKGVADPASPRYFYL